MDTAKTLSVTRSKIFLALYMTGFAGAILTALFSCLPFSRAVFNMPWANIVYFLFIALLFITAFVHGILIADNKWDIITDICVFPIGLTLLVLNRYVDGAVRLLAILYSATVTGAIAVRHALALRNGKKSTATLRQFLATAILILSVINVKETYIDDTYIAWSLIPAAVLTCVAGLTAYLILRSQLPFVFPNKATRIGMSITFIFLTFILTMCLSFSAIAATNSVFDGSGTTEQYVVLNKTAPTLFDSNTEYSVTVEIDGEEKQIRIPASDHSNINNGDVIVVERCGGALGFEYLRYRDKQSGTSEV